MRKLANETNHRMTLIRSHSKTKFHYSLPEAQTSNSTTVQVSGEPIINYSLTPLIMIGNIDCIGVSFDDDEYNER